MDESGGLKTIMVGYQDNKFFYHLISMFVRMSYFI